jgi:hypothetical protein
VVGSREIGRVNRPRQPGRGELRLHGCQIQIEDSGYRKSDGFVRCWTIAGDSV